MFSRKNTGQRGYSRRGVGQSQKGELTMKFAITDMVLCMSPPRNSFMLTMAWSMKDRFTAVPLGGLVVGLETKGRVHHRRRSPFSGR